MITDDGRIVAETGAIVEYILSRYGAGKNDRRRRPIDRLRYTYWLHFAEGSAMPPLVMTLLFGEMPKRTPFLLRPVAQADRQNRADQLPGAADRATARPDGERTGRSAYFAGPDLPAPT